MGLASRYLSRLVIIDPPKPKRRALGRFIWPILITVAAIVALVVADAGQSTRAQLEYLDELHTQASDIALGAEALFDVTSQLNSVDRVEFVTTTDAIRADLAAGIAHAELGAPTDALVAVNALYRQALQAWNRGVTGLASGVLVAADDPEDVVAADNIADALAELRAGDDLYLQLVAELEREETPSPVAPMPAIEMLRVDTPLASLSQLLVTAARAPSSALALRPGLGISQLVADPRWVVDPDGQAVMPATDEVTLFVVISNSGNVTSFPEQLIVTLTGGAEPVEMSFELEPIQPGRQRTIQVDSIPVEPGVAYEVSAVLFVTNPDVSLDDNEISVVFRVNEG